MKSTPTVASFLANPTLGHAEKQAGLTDVVKRLGGSASDYTKNFLNVLAENGRLYETEKVLEGFEQIMSAHRGELQVTVTCECSERGPKVRVKIEQRRCAATDWQSLVVQG